MDKLIDIARDDAEDLSQYINDRTLPCVRFTFNVLEKWNHDKYAVTARTVRNLSTRSVHRPRKPDLRHDQFIRYIMLLQFIEVELQCIIEGDVVLLQYPGEKYITHCGIWSEGKILHLSPRDMAFTVSDDGDEFVIVKVIRR